MKDNDVWGFVALIIIALGLAFFTIKHEPDPYLKQLETETTIASLKNRWVQMNDELTILKKENEKLRRDVRRINKGRHAEEDLLE